MSDLHSIRFKALTEAFYHSMRLKYFLALTRWSNLVIVIGGTGIAFRATSVLQNQYLDWGLGMATALAGGTQLVFDFAGRAREHEKLKTKYFDLLAKIEEEKVPTQDFFSSIEAQILKIASDAPPMMRAVNAVAYNQAYDAIYGDRPEKERLEQRIVVRPVYRALKQFFPFANKKFLTATEITESAKLLH